MTAAEACALLLESTRQLSAVRAECEGWRVVALAALENASELRRELAMVDQREYIHRTRSQDTRDVFLDQRDLREAA